MSTRIAWADEVWNPTRGCTRVSAGCVNCYAERQAHRFSTGKYEGLTVLGADGSPRWSGEVRLVPDNLPKPLTWRKPRRVFVDSMSDLFHDQVPDDYLLRVFDIIVQAGRLGHTFIILTKRPERMADFAHRLRFDAGKVGADELGGRPGGCYLEGTAPPEGVVPTGAKTSFMPILRHVRLGVSVENQETANERIPILLSTPAAIRCVSYEPALGPVDFTNLRLEKPQRERWHLRPVMGDWVWMDALGGEIVNEGGLGYDCPKLDWVIVGGESGPGARPCDVAWIRSTIEACRRNRVACFVKQLGAHPVFETAIGLSPDLFKRWDGDPKASDPSEWPDDLRVQQDPAA